MSKWMTRAQKTTMRANERALERAHPVAEKTPPTICQNRARTTNMTEGAKLNSTSDSMDAESARGVALVMDSRADERALERAHPVAEKTPLTICRNSARTTKMTEGAKLNSTSDSMDAENARGVARTMDSMMKEVKEEARTRPVVTDRAADERGEHLAPHRRRPAMLLCVRGTHGRRTENSFQLPTLSPTLPSFLGYRLFRVFAIFFRVFAPLVEFFPTIPCTSPSSQPFSVYMFWASAGRR